MSAATADTWTGSGPVEEERARILCALLDRVDDLTSTGYPDRYDDLVVYGACKRLLPALEAARMQLQSVETTERAALVPPQSAAKAASLYASLYSERLEQERALMFDDVPNYAHYQGS